jgi:tetratricopeptide (TPR) repeat protein
MGSKYWGSRVAILGVFVAALAAVPATASAQIGTLAGKVVDGQGKPVPDATIVFDNPSLGQHLETKTDKKGEWVQPGLMLGAGNDAWKGIVKKDGFADEPIRITQIRMNSVTDTPIVQLRAAKAAIDLGKASASAAKNAEVQKAAGEAAAAFEAKNYDVAIAKLNEVAGLIDKCAVCFTKIGDAYMGKGNNVEAETAYQKAIEYDAEAPEAYEALANIYNQQRKYEDAAKMSSKASEIRTAKSGGVVDPETEYNAAVIAFNQSKIPEARTHLEKVLALKPDHAEAHYLYGMVLVNQGKIDDAKKELQKYLELAPTGTNADTAKAILAMQ